MSLRDRLAHIRSSFQFQLFLLFTLLTAAITFLFVTLYVVHEIHESRLRASQALQLRAEGFADSIRLPLYAENTDLLMRYAEEVLRLPQIRAVEILNYEGRALVKLPAAPSRDAASFLSKTVQVRTLPMALTPVAPTESEPDARGILVGYVRLYRGTDDLSRSGRTLVATACALSLLFWLLISCSCYLLLRRVTRSFQALMRGLANVHGGDYVSRIEVRFDDEPGKASASVNELAESLGQRDEENRRLNAELVAAMELEVASKKALLAINGTLEEEIAEGIRIKSELKNLVAQLPVGIIWSGCDGSIEYLNHFMLERIGYAQGDVGSVDDWLSRACPDTVHRERHAGLRRAAIDAWKDGAVDSFYDVQVICKDGSVRDLHCSNQISGTRIVDIMVDMTERELLQQQIIRNQKLESIGVLAGGIAHNFNNALTGVLGYVTFARKFLSESHKAYDLLLDAEKATKRASGLANQLLTFANGGAPVRKAVCIVSIVEESVSLATSGSSVMTRLNLPSSLHFVNVDNCQICQAFQCLCVNAVQAMPEGGVLTVSGRNVSTDQEKLPVPADGDYVELCFEDEGCGIAEQDWSKIFTPYFTTKAHVGTGLGLSTVHSIITRHGGAINFVSKPGKGTSFTMYLPVAGVAEPEGQPEQTEPAAASLTGSSVPVMDDEEMTELSRDVLEAENEQELSRLLTRLRAPV